MPLLHTLMMSRRPSSIGWMKRRVTFRAPNTLTANMRSQSASLVSRVVIRPVRRIQVALAHASIIHQHIDRAEALDDRRIGNSTAWLSVTSITNGSPPAASTSARNALTPSHEVRPPRL